jgi:hypothetical protein
VNKSIPALKDTTKTLSNKVVVTSSTIISFYINYCSTSSTKYIDVLEGQATQVDILYYVIFGWEIITCHPSKRKLLCAKH